MKYEIRVKIKELRKEKGLTQKQLAKLVNKSETGLASWEQGLAEPRVNDVRLLCKIFEVSADYIAGTSTDRTYKTLNTGCTKLDLNLLNEHGLHILYTHYEYLISQPEYRKK